MKTKYHNATHGESDTDLYKKWCRIRERCRISTGYKFESYKKRGIKVCEEWDKDYISFKKWAINNGYSKDLSIDRINNDGNYEASNCRWTTNSIQSHNTRKIRTTNTSGYRGVSWRKDCKRWRSAIRINNKYIHLGHFDYPYTAGYAYDCYVIKHNTEHTRNFK